MLEPCDTPADTADLARVTLESLQLWTIPQLDALAGFLVFDDLVRWLIAPDLERLFQRFVAFLTRDDDGGQPEPLRGGEKRTEGLQGVPDDHKEPGQALLHGLDQPHRRRQLA